MKNFRFVYVIRHIRNHLKWTIFMFNVTIYIGTLGSRYFWIMTLPETQRGGKWMITDVLFLRIFFSFTFWVFEFNSFYLRFLGEQKENEFGCSSNMQIFASTEILYHVLSFSFWLAIHSIEHWINHQSPQCILFVICWNVERWTNRKWNITKRSDCEIP